MTKKPTVCVEITSLDSLIIKLEQAGIQNFIVTYGQQVTKNLRYPEACAELGACIMHALACAGRLDNRLEGED